MFSGTALICHRGRRLVFSGVDFSLGGGEALFLTGANGSGKSSLLRMMSGLLSPVSGAVLWDGQDIAKNPDDHRARLCLITQDDPVKPELSALEHLNFWARVSGAGGDGKNLRGILARFGLERQENSQGRFLSAGQRRRLNLCRLLLRPVPLWLLDEPKTALDLDSARVFQSAMDDHRAQGGRLVMATHDAAPDLGGIKKLAL